MFRHRNLFIKILNSDLKGISERGLKTSPLPFVHSRQALFSGIIIERLEKCYFLQRKFPEDVISKKFLSKFKDGKCWNCNQNLELKGFSCASCAALQHPKKNVNYFELFGISEEFDINSEDLSKKFKNLQKTFHPDKFVNKSKEELEISEAYSRLVNKAYTTLKDPLSRGTYLLELHNLPVEGTPLAQDFLMTVMERNEELDAITSDAALSSFAKTNNEDLEKQLALVSHTFRNCLWEEARKNILMLNYFVNLNSKIKQKQSDLNSRKNS